MKQPAPAIPNSIDANTIYRIAVLVFFGLIVYFTLFSFKFDFSVERLAKGFSKAETSLFFNQRGHLALGVDLLSNIALYLPLGFCLYGFFRSQNRHSHRACIIQTLLIAGSLSLGTEILQLFLPHRFSSINDFMTNLAGTIIGCTIAKPLHKKAARLLQKIVNQVRMQPLWLVWLLVACIQLILALAPYMLSIYPDQLQMNFILWKHSLANLFFSLQIFSKTNLETYLLATFLALLLAQAANRSDTLKCERPIQPSSTEKVIGSMSYMFTAFLFYPMLALTQLFVQKSQPQAGFLTMGIAGTFTGLALHLFVLNKKQRSDQFPGHKPTRWHLVLFVLYLTSFAIHFFYPFQINITNAALLSSVTWIPYDVTTVNISTEYVLQHFKALCLAIPIGIYFAAGRKAIPFRHVLFKVIWTCVFISITIELIQLAIPGRMTDLSDVLDFALGGVIGVFLLSLWEKYASIKKLSETSRIR